MKKLLVICFIVFANVNCFANQVDNLQSNLEIQDFLCRILNSRNDWRKIKKVTLCHWQKLDVNNDKQTDILIQASLDDYIYQVFSFVAVDNGTDVYNLTEIGLREDGYIAKIINDHSQTLIIHNSTNYNYDYPKHYILRQKKEYVSDTLIYRYGGFVERSPHPSNYKIDSIKFTWFSAWAKEESPDRELVIAPNLAATYTYRRDNIIIRLDDGDLSKRYRDYTSVIKAADVNEIYSLINYISIKNLRDHYSIGATDNYTATIRIKFSDGSVKYITDYGEEGSFGLKLLYKKLFALIANQNWK